MFNESIPYDDTDVPAYADADAPKPDATEPDVPGFDGEDVVYATIEDDEPAEVDERPVLTITDKHRELLEHVGRILILDAPDDVAVVAEHASGGLIVVGLDGADGWHEEASLPRPEIADLLRRDDAHITIAFTGMKGRASIHAEAAALGAHLGTLAKVDYLQLGAASPAATLAVTPDARRTAYLDGLLKSAKTSVGAKPPAERVVAERAVAVAVPKPKPLAPMVDVARGVIVTPGAELMDPETVWLNAAVERVVTYRAWNDLTNPKAQKPVISHDLLIHIPTSFGLEKYLVEDVRDEDLKFPRRYLNSAPGGESVTLNYMFAAGRVGETVDAAIRGHGEDNIERREIILRNGFRHRLDRWGYLTPDGTVTGMGMDVSARAKLSKMHQAHTLLDTAGMSRDEELAAAVEALAALGHLGTWGIRTGLMGALAYGLGAMTGAGRGAGSVTVLVGIRGSGKSSILRRFHKAFVAPNAIGPTMRAHDKAAIHRNGYRGMENGIVTVDDFKAVHYDPRDDSEYARFDSAVRPGYEGGAGGSAKSVQDVVTGEWDSDTSDPSCPTMYIGTEKVPTGPARDIGSTMERLFAVRVTAANAFTSGRALEWEEATNNNPLLHLHTSAYVAWVCRQLDRAGTLDVWRAPWLEIEQEERAKLHSVHSKITPRGREVAVAPVIGMMIWTTYLLEIGAISEAEREEIISKSREAAWAIAVEHNRAIGDDVPLHARILDVLTAGVISGRYRLNHGNDDESTSNAPVLALGRVVDGIDAVAVIPTIAVQALRADPEFASFDRTMLVEAMKPLIAASTTGQATKKLHFAGASGNFIVIRREEWGDAGLLDPDAESIDEN
ncbi:hypothetical protein [Leifsonia sp. Leaf264]|uniref:hypothetical protein n=1 Tax=Leifsonia sp. Leaf264 TaxID=1736314 RepID=UPI0006FC98ED|nr:hypothetical protein [Leifsonia sp. Leaf264]KQP01430.1 hypothetical protein ASF30_02090 [Leifsonia sp. Leaf264]